MIKVFLASIFLFIALPAMAQSASDFAQANALADAQWKRRHDETSKYADAWAAFNNAQHLDERDGCYFKAQGELTQVLEIDATGKVAGYYTDRENARSQCWRVTYLGLVFPKPPFAPYWHKLVMH
ncbi:hypothetical protein [Xanthomonas sp. NCPPB 1128]|uniref:hypothetical protein n=1 Tax=Xanthomonas sp. NCPPB 1128 TaxID=1775876 RepID=UPI00069EE405|nr:hypothetical protein [Xanthomonas sp. NCPPB 1128]